MLDIIADHEALRKFSSPRYGSTSSRRRSQREIAEIPSPRNPEEPHVSSYERFVLSPPKSFFKKLFVGSTKLGYRLKTMSERNGVVKGLKDQECEKGTNPKRPPIAYVPVIDEVQEKLNLERSEGSTYTIKLPNDTRFQAGVWFSGTPEQFLNHVKQALNAIKRMGLFEGYNTAYEKREKFRKLHEQAKTDVATAVKADTTESIRDDLVAVRNAHLASAKEADAERIKAAEGFFSQYANLLSVEQRISWEKIVDQQIDTAPWTDLKGRKRLKKRTKTQRSFMDCMTNHLLTVFDMDAAEKQRYYISNTLRKPNKVTIRAFFTRVEQLNSYIKLLPSLYNSPKATEYTKPARPFDEAELAMLLLNMCPLPWQAQYDVTQETVPQDTRRLLLVLENIEKLGATLNPPAKQPPSNNGGNRKPNGNSEKAGKRKGMSSSASRIPKKQRVEKHCNLCQKHGGAQDTHNTNECTKYEKDGTLKSEWAKKSSAKAPGKIRKSDGKSFSQVMDRLAKMEKAMKKGKSSSRKKKRYYSSDSDSDSE